MSVDGEVFNMPPLPLCPCSLRQEHRVPDRGCSFSPDPGMRRHGEWNYRWPTARSRAAANSLYVTRQKWMLTLGTPEIPKSLHRKPDWYNKQWWLFYHTVIVFLYDERKNKQQGRAAYIQKAEEMYKKQPTENATYGENVSNHLLRD